jgi:hypothetical protein
MLNTLICTQSADSYHDHLSNVSALIGHMLCLHVCGVSLSLALPHHDPTLLSQFFTSSLMSHSHTTSTPSNFQLILDNALKAYNKCAKKDLLKHPLADRLEACKSPSSILSMLQEQVQDNGSQRSNERLTKWLDPTVNVLYAFCGSLGEGVGFVSFRT